MANDNNGKSDESPGYVRRVFQNDSTKKGLAAGAAGVIIGAILELLP
jgi:hypothetical protein